MMCNMCFDARICVYSLAYFMRLRRLELQVSVNALIDDGQYVCFFTCLCVCVFFVFCFVFFREFSCEHIRRGILALSQKYANLPFIFEYLLWLQVLSARQLPKSGSQKGGVTDPFVVRICFSSCVF